MPQITSQITVGNIASIIATVLSILGAAIAVTNVVGNQNAQIAVHALRLNAIEAQLQENRQNERVLNEKMNGMQGDIRVIRQILEGGRAPK
jgi:hypothetical protein